VVFLSLYREMLGEYCIRDSKFFQIFVLWTAIFHGFLQSLHANVGEIT
jgi:hypothetical protein